MNIKHKMARQQLPLQSGLTTSQKGHRWMVLLVAVLAMALSAMAVQAQERCFPDAVGVPGLGGPPDWFSGGAAPQFQPVTNDPRWRGAVSDTFNNGAGEEASSRALYSDSSGTRSLYLSFKAKLDTTADADLHRVYLGLSDNSGTSAYVIRINLSTVAPTGETAGTDFVVAMWQRTGTSWTAVATPPVWIESAGATRAWIKSNTWFVHVRIPITTSTNINTGLNLGSLSGAPPPTFLMWYNILRGTPIVGGTSLGVVPFTLPRTAGAGFTKDTPSGSGPNFPAPDSTNWQPSRFSSGPSDTGCLNDGVSLYVGDIGTENPVSSQILWKPLPGSSPQPRPVNTFFARPRFNSVAAAADIPPGGIKATFRIANWGSQPDPNQVAAGVVLWDAIPGGTNVASGIAIPVASPTPPAGSDLPYPAPTPPNGPLSPISFPWQLTDAQAADFEGANPNKRTHQCMLVELSGGSLKFYNDSVVRNMDFEDASEMKREAEISVVGLTPVSATPRDVYLLVEVLNMPAVPKVPPGPNVGRVRGGGTKGMTGAGMTIEELDRFMPTYRVYVYHDTGRKFTTEKGTFPILEPQGSFGYYVRHEGEIEGWKHRLEGAQQIAPNFYLIKVPNNGKATVSTTIEAVEPGIVNPPGFKRWGLSLHAGLSIPHGNFNTFYNPGPNFGFDLEYRITPTFSLEGIYGFHHFNGDNFGLFTVSDVNVHQLSLNGKVYGGTAPVRPFFNFGGGAYVFTPGANTHGGLNVGGGFQFAVTPNFAVDTMYNFHNVFTSGSSTQFSTIQGGVRFRF